MNDDGYQPFPDISAWTAVPFDVTTYAQYAAILEQARAEATEEAREHAVTTAIRYAGTDTGAIEGLYTTDRGFTRTVAIEAAHWEVAAAERGPNAAAIIKDQIEASEWALDLVTQKRPVTEHVIRELHAMLCRSQDVYVVHTEVGQQERALPKGEYKAFPNNPTSLTTGRMHYYASPDMVGPEMARLVASLSSDEYLGAHPVVQAAYLHYAIAAVHPFADGNGRVARALASVPFYRAARVPLLVFRDERDRYIDALEAADSGKVGQFVGFVSGCVLDAIDLVVAMTRGGMATDRDASLDRLREALAPSPVPQAEFEAIAGRLLHESMIELNRQIDSLGAPDGLFIRADMSVHGPGVPPLPHFVNVAGPLTLRMHSELPAHADTMRSVMTAVTPSEERSPRAALYTNVPGHEPLLIALSDVHPTFRESARIRIAAWLGRLLDDTLAHVADQAEKSRGASSSYFWGG